MSKTSLKVISRTPNSTIFCFGQGANKVAIKTVPSNNLKLALHLRNEHCLLKKLNHRNIVRVFKYEQNLAPSGNTTNSQSKQSRNSLVLEYADKGTLLNCIQHLQVSILVNLFRQICEGVDYLHARDICHRDLKLDNILVFQEEKQVLMPKICDFGFASLCKKGKKEVRFNQFKGTRQGFMAPEIFAARNNQQLDYDGKKADIFALGVIIFALVFKKLPFEEANAQNRLYKLLIDQKYSQFWSYHSIERKQLQIGNLDEFKCLFVTMVNILPKERPCICQIIQNSWIKGMGEQAKHRAQNHKPIQNMSLFQQIQA